MTTKRIPFYCDCVSWPEEEIDLLHELKDSGQDISRATFLKNVDLEFFREIEKNLGYDKNFKMANDWHVDYYSHKESGIKFFIHSAIEYVFADHNQIAALKKHVDRKLEEEASDEGKLNAGEYKEVQSLIKTSESRKNDFEL